LAEDSKAFFSEEKQQKTFVRLSPAKSFSFLAAIMLVAVHTSLRGRFHLCIVADARGRVLNEHGVHTTYHHAT
jgi:hypothetical protein